MRYSIIHVNSFVRIEDARFKRLRRKPYSYFCILESPLKYTYLPFWNTLCITHYKILSFRILSQSLVFAHNEVTDTLEKRRELFSRTISTVLPYFTVLYVSLLDSTPTSVDKGMKLGNYTSYAASRPDLSLSLSL